MGISPPKLPGAKTQSTQVLGPRPLPPRCAEHSRGRLQASAGHLKTGLTLWEPQESILLNMTSSYCEEIPINNWHGFWQ